MYIWSDSILSFNYHSCFREYCLITMRLYIYTSCNFNLHLVSMRNDAHTVWNTNTVEMKRKYVLRLLHNQTKGKPD